MLAKALLRQILRWSKVVPDERIAIRNGRGTAALRAYVHVVSVVLQYERSTAHVGVTLVGVTRLKRIEDQLKADAVEVVVLVVEDELCVV